MNFSGDNSKFEFQILAQVVPMMTYETERHETETDDRLKQQSSTKFVLMMIIIMIYQSRSAKV